ncbi:cupin domain-containing protein [Catellatospora bangladeshensis]|uniref:cupin domain-containing protein n=1 Tax=Catellatospora bangladeshensis TaxID=310355 RepID=UPI0036188D73
MLDPSVLLREIVVYPGARTSIHCHMHQSELNIVAEGAVEILLGTHPAKLRTRLVMAGHAYRVPAGTYHAVRFARPAHPATRPWARLFELVTGFAAPDDIERHEPAVPGGPLRMATPSSVAWSGCARDVRPVTCGAVPAWVRRVGHQCGRPVHDGHGCGAGTGRAPGDDLR